MRETPDAARAFERYYDLGEDRSLEKLAQQMHQEATREQNHNATKRIPTVATLLSHLKKWSTSHGWQNRVIERDAVLAEKNRKKRHKETERMNDEQALLGRTQALRAVKQIEALIEAKALGGQAAVQLFKYATDLERIARGAATEQVAVTGKDGDAIEVNITDVRERLAQKIAGARQAQQMFQQQQGESSA